MEASRSGQWRARLSVCFGLICWAATVQAEIQIDLPLDAQINNGGSDAITTYGAAGDLEFPSDGGEGWTRRNITASGWYWLSVDFELAGAGKIDLSGNGNTLSFWCRYYQGSSQAYNDAPIFVTLNSDNGGWREFGIVYQTSGGWQCDPIDRYPSWHQVTIDVNDLLADYECDGNPNVNQSADFDPTQVTQLTFYGTDWTQQAGIPDWVDVRDLQLIAAGQELPPPSYVVRPVLFVPDPNSFPVGYQPTQAEIDADAANIWDAMRRARRFYARAMGLATSFKLEPVAVVMAPGGLGDYGITWTDPERRYRDGIAIGDTWGTVIAGVDDAGYEIGIAGAPRIIVTFCKGAGGFAGGAQWFGVTGGGFCLLGDWCLDSLAERVPSEWWDWWTGRWLQIGAAAHEFGHTLGLAHPDALNPLTEEQDYPYTIMGSWWNWPDWPENPAEPDWPWFGLHGWAENSTDSVMPSYQDQFLLDHRLTWFAHPLADIDDDGDIDVHDASELQRCLGADGDLLDDCFMADVNQDVTVDANDFETYESAVTGPLTP